MRSLRPPRFSRAYDTFLTLQSYKAFILTLPVAFALIAFGLDLSNHDKVFIPTLLFVGAGLVSLLSFKSSGSISRPLGGEFKQIEIEHHQIEKLIRNLEVNDAKESSFGTDKIFHDLYRSFLNIANSGSTIISSEVSAACAVSVKLLWREPEDEDNVTIRRFIRDSNSRRRRASAPEGFSFADNTAFRTIALNQDGSDYFVSDNLSLLEAQENYVNINKHWPELYNSTAVAPIKSGDAIIGFICVDSWYGKLSGTRVRRLVEHLASHVYTGLQLLITIDSSSKQRANADVGFIKSENKLAPRNVEAQLSFQRAVLRLHAAVQPIIDREDDAIIRQQRASLRRPAVELGVPNDASPLTGGFMTDDNSITDEIPIWALDQQREKLSKKASQISESDFVEILKRSASGNPYAEGLLESHRRKQTKP